MEGAIVACGGTSPALCIRMLPAFDIPAFAGSHLSLLEPGFKILNTLFVLICYAPAVQIKKDAIAGAVKADSPFEQKFDGLIRLCSS